MADFLTNQEIERIINQDTSKLQKNTFFDQLLLILRNEEASKQETLQEVCNLIPTAWKLPAEITARISFDNTVYESPGFAESETRRMQDFSTSCGARGVLEIFHQRGFAQIGQEGYKEEEVLTLERITRLMVYYIENIMPADSPSDKLEELFTAEKSNLHTLSIINQVVLTLKESVSLNSALHQIVFSLPEITQFPNLAAARIGFDNKVFSSRFFRETPWVLREKINTPTYAPITLEVYLLKEFPRNGEVFLPQEKLLLQTVARVLHNYLKSAEGSKIVDDYQRKKHLKQSGEKSDIKGKELLQNFLNRSNSDRDIYHDLMPFKVKEILLVANLYDAFSIEKEGRFSEYILGEYHQLNLTSLPRITGASNLEEARARLAGKHFDMVIVMMGANKKAPLEISEKLKAEFHYVPIFLLLNNNSDAEAFSFQDDIPEYIDDIFAWNGDSRIFFAMVKLLEDKTNAKTDTKIGMSRIILLVEDSVSYYSRYLPLFYHSIMKQTKRIIDDVTDDELYKVLRMRARPKVLLARNYEQAMQLYHRFRDYLLCVITDVSFKHKGQRDALAGFRLVEHIKSDAKGLPVAIQSNNIKNKDKAQELATTFINKNSQSLQHEIQNYISFHLGFGDFLFRNSKGKHVATARNLREFEEKIRVVPEESLLYHARHNHFSLWLNARGETEIARHIAPYSVHDFRTCAEVRQLLLNILDHQRREKQKGKVIDFSERALVEGYSTVMLRSGALGGKGRGVAFINTLLNYFDFSDFIPGIKIKLPRTVIIGNDEFSDFIQHNNLFFAYQEKDFERVKKYFAQAELSQELRQRLKIYLKHIRNPLAIRSSGLFEDSLMQPFAGIFSTYLLPNNHHEPEKRLEQLMLAVKLVFASLFSGLAKGFIEAINYKVDDERMAVVIQELVGKKYGRYFYPHISGVAQSFNFYAHGYIQPEDGYAVTALGLGKYVVEGHKAYGFTPKYPDTRNYSTKELFKNSQVDFLALDLGQDSPNLLAEGENAGIVRVSIDEAEQHGTLKHLASVYDPDSDRLRDGLDFPGPRVITFANILKHNYIPMAQALDRILDIIREAFGTAVEIEFAVDLDKDHNGLATFYLLQIKPLVGAELDTTVQLEPEKLDNALLYSENSMGNGYYTDVQDVIYLSPERFDKQQTQDMAEEIEWLNAEMKKQEKGYILIGPGRWGTSDRFLGVPVIWTQISEARMIVELGWEDFILDASLGSHFFHNVTSMKVGYLSVHTHKASEFVRWGPLHAQPAVNEGRFFRHVRFPQPLEIVMDGKSQKAAVILGDDTIEP